MPAVKYGGIIEQMELKDNVYQLTTYNAIAAEGIERFE